MKSIIFDSTPLDIAALHDAKKGTAGINGALVFYYAAIQAMLEYSSYVKFVFLSRRERDPFSLANSEQFKNSKRNIQVIHPTELDSLGNLDQAVLVTSTERLGPSLRLRRMLKSRCIPVTGF